jgi:hypothetical protein
MRIVLPHYCDATHDKLIIILNNYNYGTLISGVQVVRAHEAESCHVT